MKKRYYILPLTILLLALSGSTCFAQSSKKKAKNSQSSLDVPFRNELYFGGGIHTRGWNLHLNYGFIKSYNRTMSFFAEFGEITHPKERLQRYELSAIIGGDSKAFIYGKRNRLFVNRIGYAEKRYLSSKETSQAVSLAWTYGGGISLGIVKPYYLNLIYRSANNVPTIRPEKYSQSNWTRFLDPEQVNGPAGGSYGWDEALLEPGFFIKTALLVDWGAFDSIAKSFEIGITMDTYFNRIPLLISEENTPIFVNLYLHVHLGKRW